MILQDAVKDSVEILVESSERNELIDFGSKLISFLIAVLGHLAVRVVTKMMEEPEIASDVLEYLTIANLSDYGT